MSKATIVNPLDLVEKYIAELEASLGLQPGETLSTDPAPQNVEAIESRKASSLKKKDKASNNNNNNNQTKKKNSANPPESIKRTTLNPEDLPDICKLEFRVGQIRKVWVHPTADKLYCEEIDVGEGTPRQIASGLRPHFTTEQMLGQRLLVVCNLKAKNLVGFKSHGMVLCAATNTTTDSEEQEQPTEIVEFVEPPPDAVLGEIVTFEGLPPPQPWSAAQVEKKKVFAACMDGMKTSDDCKATWNGHVFMTSAGPCTTKSIAGGVLR